MTQLTDIYDIENVIIGSILCDRNCHDIVFSELITDDFAKPENKQVYNSCLRLYVQSRPVDLVTLIEDMKANNEPEPLEHILHCTNIVTSTVNIKTHVYYQKNRSVKRALAEIGYNLTVDALKNEVDGITQIINLNAATATLLSRMTNKKVLTFRETVIQTMEEALNNDGKTELGLPTGFDKLDAIMNGLCAPDFTIIAAGPGEGKCLGYGTNVMLSNGDLVEVQNLKVGDKIMGVSGERTILKLYRGKDTMYRIDQCKGISYVVNSKHILSLRMNYKTKDFNHGDIINISVEDYLKKHDKFKHHAKGYKSNCLIFEKNEVKVDPYYLGLWLGDGTSESSNITTADIEVINYIEQLSLKINHKFRKVKNISNGLAYKCTLTKSKSQSDRNSSLQADLRNIGVLKNKHIPKIYLLNDVETRLNLLAGIIDSDGYLSKGYQYELIFKNERLANDVVWLARSLGFSVSINNSIKKCYNNGVLGNYFRIYINGNIDIIPTIIKRKQNPTRKINKNHLNTGIKITEIGYDNYYGFELDGDGLFLLEDFTVTHNSTLALNVARYNALKGNEVLFFSLEMKEKQLIWKLLSDELELPVYEIRRGNFDAGHVFKTKLVEAKMTIYDKAGISIDEMCGIVKTLKREKGIKLVIIDYLQLLKIGNVGRKVSTRNDEVTIISNKIKELAMETDLPIIALSQLNRDKTRRFYTKSDLRDSGSLEQDADNIIFIFRPCEHDMTTYEIGTETIPCDDYTAIINLDKCRLGKTGEFVMAFKGEYSRFENLYSYEERQSMQSENRMPKANLSEDLPF